MLRIPLLRAGRPYRSLEGLCLHDVGTGDPVAEVSQANRGLIAKDLEAAADHRKALRKLPVSEILAVLKRAAVLFAEKDLPVDPLDGVEQSPEDYVRHLSATTGMPRSLCRANMEKIRFVMAEMETVLGGLTRGLDLSILDAGWSSGERNVSYLSRTDSLGAVLPSNSPGVHSLWLPAIGLKVPVALKPGGEEPWTPFRIAQALMAAGCPSQAFGFYPSDHSGAAEILLRCRRSMLFGDASTVGSWKEDRSVQVHGPGYSKVLFGEDRMASWEHDVDLVIASIAENGGRSCLNASGIWVPSQGREIAAALAGQLVKIDAKPMEDPQARLAAFPRPEVAHRISGFIDRQLQVPGAEDVTAPLRQAGRVVERQGCTFLLPTLIRCDDPEHPLARQEFLFPFATVVEVPQREMLARIGPTLVATAITEDGEFRRALMDSRMVDRLNLGRFPTSRVSWDQPHEGNLFEHLYRQRAFQTEQAVSH